MSREDRVFQQAELDALRYIAFLLEWIAHKASPGNMDFAPFQDMLKGKYHNTTR